MFLHIRLRLAVMPHRNDNCFLNCFIRRLSQRSKHREGIQAYVFSSNRLGVSLMQSWNDTRLLNCFIRRSKQSSKYYEEIQQYVFQALVGGIVDATLDRAVSQGGAYRSRHGTILGALRNNVAPGTRTPSRLVTHRATAREQPAARPPSAMAYLQREPLLQQVYQHVVLPRDVPGHEDGNLHQIDAEIARRLIDAVKQLVNHAPTEDFAKLDAIRLMLSTCGSLNVEGMIDKAALTTAFQQLEGRQALVLHVTEQNAALLIYRHVG
jgi:hypothetical protein